MEMAYFGKKVSRYRSAQAGGCLVRIAEDGKYGRANNRYGIQKYLMLLNGVDLGVFVVSFGHRNVFHWKSLDFSSFRSLMISPIDLAIGEVVSVVGGLASLSALSSCSRTESVLL
jgi:hypothetical protein